MSSSNDQFTAMAVHIAAFNPEILQDDDAQRASVALIVNVAKPIPSVLIIQRATHDADPWSGHLAFPGGRFETADPSLLETARRETLEETGINLNQSSVHPLGRMSDIQGRARGERLDMIISCFVFCVDQTPEITPNYEVARTFWVPLTDLTDAQRHFEFFPRTEADGSYPGIRITDHCQPILWGLTFRFVKEFLEIIQQPMP